ncbi:MAG: hypothetical protein ABIK28_01955 [Planctomycetota bacterium]
MIGGDSQTQVEGNFVSYNRSAQQGGGIFSNTWGGKFADNIVCYNEAGGGVSIFPYYISGGGIFFAGDSQPVPTVSVENCLVYHNETEERSGGVYVRLNASVYMTNCTVAHNTAPLGKEICMEDVLTGCI